MLPRRKPYKPHSPKVKYKSEMALNWLPDHPAFLTLLVTAPWFGRFEWLFSIGYSLLGLSTIGYSHLLNIVWIYPTIGYSLVGLAKHDYHAFLSSQGSGTWPKPNQLDLEEVSTLLNSNVHMNHLRVLLQCRIWSSGLNPAQKLQDDAMLLSYRSPFLRKASRW